MRTWKLVRQCWEFKEVTIGERSGAKIQFGRSKTGVRCVSPFVSKSHCSIIFKNGIFYLRDLSSTNGTYLNGNVIPNEVERELRHDDLIGLGVGEMTEPAIKEHFVFRFVKCALEKIGPSVSSKIETAAKIIPLITIEDEDSHDSIEKPIQSLRQESIDPSAVFSKISSRTPTTSKSQMKSTETNSQSDSTFTIYISEEVTKNQDILEELKPSTISKLSGRTKSSSKGRQIVFSSSPSSDDSDSSDELSIRKISNERLKVKEGVQDPCKIGGNGTETTAVKNKLELHLKSKIDSENEQEKSGIREKETGVSEVKKGSKIFGRLLEAQKKREEKVLNNSGGRDSLKSEKKEGELEDEPTSKNRRQEILTNEDEAEIRCKIMAESKLEREIRLEAKVIRELQVKFEKYMEFELSNNGMISKKYKEKSGEVETVNNSLRIEIKYHESKRKSPQQRGSEEGSKFDELIRNLKEETNSARYKTSESNTRYPGGLDEVRSRPRKLESSNEDTIDYLNLNSAPSSKRLLGEEGTKKFKKIEILDRNIKFSQSSAGQKRKVVNDESVGPIKKRTKINPILSKLIRIPPRSTIKSTSSSFRPQTSANDLDEAKMKIQTKTTAPRQAIQIDFSPGFRVGPGLYLAKNPLCTNGTNKTSLNPPNNRVINPLYKSKRPFAKEIGNDEVSEIQPTARIKPFQSPLTSDNKNKSDITIITPTKPAQMPIMQIMKDMSRVNSVGPNAKSKAVVRPKLKPEYYREMMTKGNSNSEIITGNKINGLHDPSSSSVSNSKAKESPPFQPHDEVYRDILEWNPLWLKEQATIKTPPPVTGQKKILTNLPGFLDYKSYMDTFYPLMLLELWASISQEFTKPNRNRGPERYGGKCNYDVLIEKVDKKDNCPMLVQRSFRRKSTVPYWNCLRLMTLTENKDLNKTNDLGILTVNMLKNGQAVSRQVFGFFLRDSESYQDINSTAEEYKLLPKRPEHRFKYSVTFVTHFKEVQEVTKTLGFIQRFAYISPKIRDFRAIALLETSKLFPNIINPTSPDISESYQPNCIVDIAGLVKDVVDLLNPIQRGIVNYISSRMTHVDSDLLLIHGPPGTGKTRTIVGLVLQLLKANNKTSTKHKLLICTPSNTAIDEIVRRLGAVIGNNLKMVRIGQGCEEVKQWTLDELAKKYCEGASTAESIRDAIRTTDLKIAKVNAEMVKNSDDTIAGAFLSDLEDLQNKKRLYISDLDRTRNNKKAIERAKIDVALQADVVCSTLSSSSNSFVRKYLGPPKELRNAPSIFTCCIVDEATQTNEPESLSPLMVNCDKLVLVGDPMQLPATVLSSEAEHRDFGQSLFTRLYNFYQTQSVNPVMMLTLQYRMNPEILRWPNLRFYQNKLTTSSSIESDPKRKLCILQPYLFMNINSQEDVVDSRHFSNTEEVQLIKEILLTIKRRNNVGFSIGIITPYNNQRLKLLKLLDELKENDTSKFSSTIEVDTVDSFQGREKDIILLSCVRTEELGFLKTPQRLNVSLTRAKMCLFIIGNAVCLNGNEMWRSLMDDAVRRDVFKTIPDFDSSQPAMFRDAVEKCLIPSPRDSR